MALSKEQLAKEMQTEICELRQVLETYRPGEEAEGVFGQKEVKFPKRLCIGLFGRTGCGKTSLINSLKFAVLGSFKQYKWKQVATIEKAGGDTLNRQPANLNKRIVVIDNRGFVDLSKDATLQEIQAQIDGKRGYSTNVEWEIPGGAADNYKKNEAISCVVFVFSALDDIGQSTKGLHKAVELLQKHQGLYPVAIITKVDCNDRLQRVGSLRSRLQMTGISEIFEVANITKEKPKLELSFQHTLLSFLVRCMTNGDEAAVFKHYRQKEQTGKEDMMKKQENERKRIANEKKKKAALRGVGITASATLGATIGSLAGPVGAAAGAAVGATAGGVIFAD